MNVRAGPIGRSLPRLEDDRLLRGAAMFIDDLKPEHHLHVALLRSPLASAHIKGIDAAAARRLPGVVAAFTAADLEGSCDPMRVHLSTPGAIAPDRPIIAGDRVRFVGEIVAAVVARSRYEAEDALEVIEADLDPLPAVATFEDAMADGAPLVHDTVPKNLYFLGHRTIGDVDRAFAEAHVVVDGETVHPRVSAAPMEGRGVVARPDGSGGVITWSSTQAPHIVAEGIAESLHLDADRVRVVAADIGGGFGLKAHVYTEEILLSWIALYLGETVKWIEDRSEHLQSANHARDQRIVFSAAVHSDGRVLGLRATVLSNIGAYGIRPHGPLLDPMTCAGLIPGPYDIRNYEYDSYAVASNKCPEGPYRGVGMATAALTHERLMDLIAAKLAIDPADVRRRNLVTPSQMPYTAATGHPYESGDYPAALESALTAFDYAGARAEQARARASGRLIGIGLSSYVEFTGAGSSTFKARGMVGIPGTDTARVWVGEEGRVHVQTSCPAIGQGVHTTFAQVAAAGLDIEPESVIVEQTDTAKVGRGTGSFMSRSSVSAATCTHRAAKQLRDEILNAASWRLDQPVERLSIGGSAILVDGKAAGVTLAQLAAADPAENGGHRLDVSVEYDPVQASHPYASHACLVEVDPGSGAVEIRRYVVADDCGTVINPMIVDGQIAGGVAQGVGAVLLEEITYAPDGQLLSGSFMDYLIPTAGEAPAVKVEHLVTRSTVHELGTKGIGEGGTIGSTAAVANAVADALSVSDATLPFTPARILALLRAK
ncbi:MAG TPA: xanthine dehydrogenase family protein molybdopterin-binding subunit [Candidatus Dormibacteraeota bacterium]|nr:xanthine dehydrogenase family protein molybdopterin-binding subunit [Candidatus Dormibacteraeota bacterium]